RLGIANLQRVHGLQHPLILGEHVPDAADEGLTVGQRYGDGPLGSEHTAKEIEVVKSEVTQRADDTAGFLEIKTPGKDSDRLFALAAALIVRRLAQGVGNACVIEDKCGVRQCDRHVLVLQRAAVKQNGVVCLTQAGGGLVQNATVNADLVVFGTLAE